MPPWSNARTGGRGAFWLIIKRHNQRLYRVAHAILDDHAEAEDVLQETYIRAFTHLSEFRAEARLSTWLTRIALNEALGRRTKLRPTTGIKALEAMAAPSMLTSSVPNRPLRLWISAVSWNERSAACPSTTASCLSCGTSRR